MSKWDIHGDRDFDGDVDLTDRLIEDEEFEDLMEAEAKRGIVDDLFDDEDEDDDLLLDEPVEFDSQPVTTEIVIPLCYFLTAFAFSSYLHMVVENKRIIWYNKYISRATYIMAI